MKNLPLSFLALFVVTLACVSCSNPHQTRQTAQVLSLYTAQVNAEAGRFANSRTELAKARAMNMNALDESAAEADMRNTLGLGVWKIAAGAEDVNLFGSIVEAADLAASQESALTERMEEHRKNVDAITTVAKFQNKKLAEAAKTLATLSDKPSLKGELDFLIGFISEVRTNLNQLTNSVSSEINAGKKVLDSKSQDSKTNSLSIK